MKKITLFFALLLMLLNGTYAKTVSLESAKTIAINFFKLNANNGRTSATLNATLNYTRKEADNTVDFYVFNITPGPGFVIVSANDIAVPVLAYSTEANFESDLNRTGVVDWMNHAAQHIYKGIQQNIPANERINNLWTAYYQGQKPAEMKSTAVAPLIYTLWNQEPYYNALCPLNTQTMPNTRAVTGCVATTMAQIMKYWNYPAQGTGSYSYNDSPPWYSNNYGTQSADFGATTYNWAAMPINISSSNNSIATLMYQCGVSVGMDYGTDAQNGSGAQVLSTWGGPCAQTAYVNYFSYDPNTIKGAYENAYNATDWLNLIKADLDAGRPVQYVGSDPTAGGHTWVCDGYDGNNLLHMNWGWGGSSNGFYNVNALTAGGYNFSTDESVLLGIQPLHPTTNTTTHISICGGDTVPLNAKVVNHATYTWSPATGLTCTNCAFTKAIPTATTVYTLKTDSAGIIDTTLIIITVKSKVSASATATNLTCYGAGNGVINISASGGIPNYTYNWDNVVTTNTASSNILSAGIHTITVTDAVGCSAVITKTLTQPAGIDATTTTTGAACASPDGTAEITATGGAGGLTYKWSTGDTATSLSGLTPGTYKVTVTDSRNCTTVVDAVVVQPYQIQFTTTSTNTINGQFVGTAAVENVSGGTEPYSFAWSDGETSQSISGLEAGIYTVTITDHSGCFEVASDTVISSPAAAINNISSNVFSFNVYPNPARSHVIIELSKAGINTSLKLENILGQTLLTKTLTDPQTSLDLSAYPNGMYLIELKQAGKRVVKQLVLNR